jgi:hypothetical protein
MRRTITYFKERQEQEVPKPSFLTYFLVVLGLFALFVSAYVPLEYQGPFSPTTYLGLAIFGSTFALQVAFLLAVGIHGLEGMYAWRLALKVDPANASEWYWQTLLIGFKSLNLLRARARSRKPKKQE